jgi:hypothetical protein
MTNFTHIETDMMEWEPDPGIPGFLSKPLYVDRETGAFTQIHFVPPGWGEEILEGKPYRHYHASVYERSFCLFGDFPHWEFKDPADTDGEMIVFRGGVFMDRPPMTIHGLMPEPKSVGGATTLSWNTGAGVSVRDPKAKEETFVIPFEDTRGINLEFTSPRIFPTADVAWENHPTISGWKIKPLCERAGVAGEAALVSIPPDWQPDGEHTVRGGDVLTWLFVVSGDVAVQIGDGATTTKLALKDRSYLNWDRTASLRLASKPVSLGGAIVLCVGHDLT